MELKDRIVRALKKADPSESMAELLDYMEKNGYYTCNCASHNHWRGGSAEHMWAVYRIAVSQREKILEGKRHLLKYATDEKLAIVCLLHDLCDMSVHNVVDLDGRDVSHGHGKKSRAIMWAHNVGTAAERDAVLNHMHPGAECKMTGKAAKEEYEALHTLVCKADIRACGCAWNAWLFKNGKTQRRQKDSEAGYLRATAMDRTKQILENGIYLDCGYNEHGISDFTRDDAVWNCDKVLLPEVKGLKPGYADFISQLHKCAGKRENCCLVIGIDLNAQRSGTSRLCGGNLPEQDLLICSNVLNSFYWREDVVHGETDARAGKSHHHYKFSLRDVVKPLLRGQSADRGIFLPQVTFFRDGADNGFRMVAPWKCDVLLVPGMKGAGII